MSGGARIVGPAGRVLSRDVRAMLLFGAALMVMLSTLAPAEPKTTPIAVLSSVRLTDDDGDRALFSAADLGPGAQVSHCIRVEFDGAEAPNVEVHFDAIDVAGTLASALRVQVEHGTGGGFDDCTGFTGTVLYDDGLTGLTEGDPAAPGVATGWLPQAGDARTYRITVTVLHTAPQGASATATFRWVLVEQAPGQPSTVPSTAPASPATPVTPTPQPSAPSAEPGVRPNKPGKPGAPKASDEAGIMPTMRRIVDAVATVAGRAAKRIQYPLGSLLVMAAFLFFQGRMDRRDPKLALAPLTEEYLHFAPHTGHEDEGR